MGEMKDKVEGTATEIKGKVTGDQEEQTKGKTQKAWGDVQGTANDVKDAVGSAVGNATDNSDRASTNVDNTPNT